MAVSSPFDGAILRPRPADHETIRGPHFQLTRPWQMCIRDRMERMFGCKVFLETWVRVRDGWSDDEAALKAFGYSD